MNNTLMIPLISRCDILKSCSKGLFPDILPLYEYISFSIEELIITLLAFNPLIDPLISMCVI